MAINHLTAAKLCVEMKIEVLLRRDDCTEVADYQHAKNIHRRARVGRKTVLFPFRKERTSVCCLARAIVIPVPHRYRDADCFALVERALYPR